MLLNNNDFKYILKKVIIFLLIFLFISFFNACEVHAEEWATSGATVTDIKYTRTEANVGNSNIYSFSKKLEGTCNGTDCSFNSKTPFYLNYVQFNYAFNDWLNGNLTWKITSTYTVNHSSFNGNDRIQCSVLNGTGDCQVTRIESTKFKIEFTGIISSHYFAIVLSTPESPDTSKSYNSLDNGVGSNYFELLDTSFSTSANGGLFYYDNSPTNTDIINSNSQNTNSIINNQNQNKEDIINNQNANTDKEIDSQRVCDSIRIYYSRYKDLPSTIGYLKSDGSLLTSASSWRVTDYIKLGKGQYVFTTNTADSGPSYCLFNNSKQLISCKSYNNLSNKSDNINLQEDGFIRFSIVDYNFVNTGISGKSCQNGNQAMNDSINDLNHNINDDNVDGANSQVDDLLNNSAFNDNSGIQSIINAPLNFINGLTNSCSPINITIPYINSDLSIPCIKQELNNHVPTLVPILSTAINGFVIYRILIDIVYLVKSSRNPDDDRIEVLDL